MNGVYCVRGMEHFGTRISKLLGWPLFVECFMGNVEKAFVCGFYDYPYYHKTLENIARAEKVIGHFCGSDVLEVNPEMLPDVTFTADGEHLVKELFDKGVDATCLYTPTFQPIQMTPLTEEKNVAVYIGNDARKYGGETIKYVAGAMPDVDFYMYGSGQFSTPQVMIDKCRVYMRLSRHDGGACSTREYLEAGRRVVQTQDIPYGVKVRPDDLIQVMRAIRTALKHDEPDEEAAAFYKAFNDPAIFVEKVNAL